MKKLFINWKDLFKNEKIYKAEKIKFSELMTHTEKMKEAKTGLLAFLLFVALFAFLIFSEVNATPSGPDSAVIESNTTKGSVGAYTLNISGGRVVVFNMSSQIQDIRWKAFIGRVTGSFTLDDASGSTVYDWSLATVAGEVYATRNSSTINWNNLTCASVADLNEENSELGHTSLADNLTATFNITAEATHEEFFVAARNISQNSCPTLNTYVANNTQDTYFEEVALYESVGGNMVFATILEQDAYGYDNRTYDFQMIVPEVGTPGWDGATAYYLYVELS